MTPWKRSDRVPSIFGGQVTVQLRSLARRIPAPGPAPTQVCSWFEEHISNERDDYGQYLYALAKTRAGDRGIVWEAGGNKRLPLVVDYATDAVPHGGRHYAFGRGTMLDRAISREQLASDPLLNWRFLGDGRYFLAGRSKGLEPDVVAALNRLVGRWPEQALPVGNPAGEPFGSWTGRLDVDIEAVFEEAILTDARLRRQLGFSNAVLGQQPISAARRPARRDDPRAERNQARAARQRRQADRALP
jgi:hypothetical protein